jgi:tetratricopeptide (TPR) repeat protein
VPLHWALGSVYAERGDTAQAAAHMRLALRCDRYNRANQTGAVVAFTQLAQELRAAGRREDAVMAAQQALDIYREYAALERGLAVNDRKFAVTVEAEWAAEESRQLLDDIADAGQSAFASKATSTPSGGGRR